MGRCSEFRLPLRRSAALCGALLALMPLAMSAPARAQSISDRLNSWILGKPVEPERADPNSPAELECPGVGVRPGASTLSVTAPGTEAGPMSTRYQATIGQTARECAALGGVMTMKVGVQGRILLGPAGGPGQLDIPLRLAVVREGTEPRTIWTKMYRLPVAIPPGQTAVPFMHVEQDVTFPLPRGDDLEAYIVYVGFDPSGAPLKPERPKKGKTKKK
jgi:hypothetical protein